MQPNHATKTAQQQPWECNKRPEVMIKPLHSPDSNLILPLGCFGTSLTPKGLTGFVAIVPEPGSTGHLQTSCFCAQQARAVL